MPNARSSASSAATEGFTCAPACAIQSLSEPPWMATRSTSTSVRPCRWNSGCTAEAEQRLHGGGEKVEGVLGEEGVEPEPLDHVPHVGRFDDRDTVRGQHGRHAGQEAVHIQYVREDVVSVNDVSAVALSRKLLPKLAAEELSQGWNTLGLGDAGDVARGLDAQHGDTQALVVAQQVPVVAGDLDGQVPGAQASLGDDAVDQRARVSKHGVGVGRKIEVVAEELFRRNRVRDLDERTRGAKGEYQWVARIGPFELILGRQ